MACEAGGDPRPTISWIKVSIDFSVSQHQITWATFLLSLLRALVLIFSYACRYKLQLNCSRLHGQKAYVLMRSRKSRPRQRMSLLRSRSSTYDTAKTGFHCIARHATQCLHRCRLPRAHYIMSYFVSCRRQNIHRIRKNAHP